MFPIPTKTTVSKDPYRKQKDNVNISRHKLTRECKQFPTEAKKKHMSKVPCTHQKRQRQQLPIQSKHDSDKSFLYKPES